jgi:hypothetical protein
MYLRRVASESGPSPISDHNQAASKENASVMTTFTERYAQNPSPEYQPLELPAADIATDDLPAADDAVTNVLLRASWKATVFASEPSASSMFLSESTR